MDNFLTTEEAAQRLGVTPARVRQLILSGQLPARKFAKVNMIDARDLELVKDRPKVGRPRKAQATNESTRTSKKGSKK
jgi:excisionase family DNA binding protein